MGQILVPLNSESDLLFIRLAREIAFEHYPIETILERFHLNAETWDKIQREPRFQSLLESEIAGWQSATNTNERTKLKAAALIEEFLPEANSKLHDPMENLPAKVELAKLVTRIAGMGATGIGIEGGGAERFSVTINLGDDRKLTFEKEVTSKVIEGEAL